MLSFDMVLLYRGRVTKSQWPLILLRGGNTCIVLCLRHVQDVKGLLAELMFGNMGSEIPTYVRSDNSDSSYQVDSVNTSTKENA